MSKVFNNPFIQIALHTTCRYLVVIVKQKQIDSWNLQRTFILNYN